MTGQYVPGKSTRGFDTHPDLLYTHSIGLMIYLLKNYSLTRPRVLGRLTQLLLTLDDTSRRALDCPQSDHLALTEREPQVSRDTLIIDNLRVKELEGENERMRELLKFEPVNPGYQFPRRPGDQARVLSEGPSNYRRTSASTWGRTMASTSHAGGDRGRAGGSHRQGLPRFLDRAADHRCQQRSGCLIQRSTSRAVGVVQGVAGGHPVMDYIAQDADVSLGDLVITSGRRLSQGHGDRPGRSRQAQGSRDVPASDRAPNREWLEIVLVITNFKPKPGQPAELEPVG